MAQLNNLIVTGSSRFLNKVYFSNGGTFNGNLNVNNGNININNGNLQLYGKVALQGYDNWLRLNNSVNGTNNPFTYGIYCGNGTLKTNGEFQVGDGGNCFKANSSAITCNKSLIVNAGADFGYGATIRNAGLELYFSTPFIDFHFDNSNNNYTSRIIEGNKGVLNINGVTCSSSNLAANNVSATNVNVSSRINADAATAIFNNVYVKDELRSTTWAIDNITNLGSTFYVSPCIIFTNPSVYINSKSGTTVTLTITDNNIISSSIGGQTWTSGSKIKLMGRINTSVLGVVNGTMARQLNTSTAKTAYITLNFATTNDCAGIEQGKTYSGSAVGDLKMMMYEVNLNVNGTTKNRPVGIRMSSYNEDKKSSIDIYDGTVDNGKPIVRMGYLGGLPAVNGENPTGYGFYAVGNAFFSGRIVSGSGKIGGFSISDYKLVNDAGNNNVIGLCSTPNKEWAIWTGASKGGDAPFHVGHDGGLYASKATIKGSITATSGKIGNCSIENGRLVLGDTMNYANLNANTYGNYGFKLVADGNNNPWFQFNDTPQRDILISPVGYNSYKCNGGEWFRIKFEFASTVQATTAEGYGSNTYVDINVGLYGKNTKGESVWYIPNGKRSNSTGSAQSVDTLVQLPSNVRSFSVYVQCRGSGTFSGTLKVRNVSVYRMMGNDLIVDGAITAAKIRSGEVTSDKIAANAITADKINVSQLSAISANLGSITGGSINIGGKFIVDSNGNFTATNGSLTGTVNATTMRAKQKYSIYDSSFNVYQDVIQWFGSSLSIGLTGGDDNGTLTVAGAYFDFLDNNIDCNGNLNIVNDGNLFVAKTTTTGSLSVSNTSTFNGATTFNSTLTCKSTSTFTGSLKAGSFTFRDYSEIDDNNIIYRRPVASAGSNKSRVAILQGTSNNKIIIKAQYNSTNFTNVTFTGSSSDVRLKKDIKDSSVNALSKIMQMQIREFNWKQTGVHQELGCVADELELIDPLLTTGGGYDDDGTMNIKSIDTLLLSEYAIKGIQELYRQNKQQQKRIEYLESQLRNK